MIRSCFHILICVCAFSFAHAQPEWNKVSGQLIFSNSPFKACHASTIVQNARGELLVACFGGSYEGSKDVAVWLCKLSKNGAVQPVKVADGFVNDTLTYPAWNPVLFKTKGGKLVLFYKIGPNPREWWGCYKSSADDGKTWSDAVRLPKGILGPVKNKPIQLTSGKILCPSSVELPDGRWHVRMEMANADLSEWTSVAVDTASAFDVIQPSILKYPGNRLQILCRSEQGNVVQSWSLDDGKTWSKLQKTSLLNPNSGTDAVTLKNGTQLIVYNPDLPGKEWYNGRANLRVAQSADGKNWTDITTLESGVKQEYSYPAVIETGDGLVHITYTYDRKNIKHVVLKQVHKG